MIPKRMAHFGCDKFTFPQPLSVRPQSLLADNRENRYLKPLLSAKTERRLPKRAPAMAKAVAHGPFGPGEAP